jgi:hypothetical protein
MSFDFCISCNYLRKVKIVEAVSDHDYSCYQQLVSSTNLFAAKREQIASKPIITAILDPIDLPRTDWLSISQVKAIFTTAKELDSIAVTSDLDRLELLGVREQHADGERSVGILYTNRNHIQQTVWCSIRSIKI